MFICTEVMQCGLCTVFDTKDFVSERIERNVLENVLKSGIKVRGCKIVDGKIHFDRSDFEVSDLADRLYMSKEVDEQGMWASIGIPSKDSPSHLSYHVYHKGSDTASFKLLLRKDDLYNIYVEKESSYNGKSLFFCMISTYDKHYYAEDRGESIGIGLVIYDGKVLQRKQSFSPTSYMEDAPSDKDIETGKFRYDMVDYDLRGR